MPPTLSFFRGQVLLVGLPLSLVSDLQQGRLGDRHRFTGVPDGETAWQLAILSPPHVVLSRWTLPDMSAVVLCQRFKANVHYSHLNDVRFLTAVESPQLQTTAGALGVDDLVEWPPALPLVEMRLQSALTVAAYHQSLQKATGQLHLIQSLLTHLHGYDPEMRLFTRITLDWALENWHLKNHGKGPVALLLLAVDRLAECETTYGLTVAQEALAAIAGRLQNQASPYSLIYRFETSTLACLWETGGDLQQFVEGLRRSIQDAPIAVQGLRLPFTLSIGLGWGFDPPTVVARARWALTQAQQQGGNRMVCQSEPNP